MRLRPSLLGGRADLHALDRVRSLPRSSARAGPGIRACVPVHDAAARRADGSEVCGCDCVRGAGRADAVGRDKRPHMRWERLSSQGHEGRLGNNATSVSSVSWTTATVLSFSFLSFPLLDFSGPFVFSWPQPLEFWCHSRRPRRAEIQILLQRRQRHRRDAFGVGVVRVLQQLPRVRRQPLEDRLRPHLVAPQVLCETASNALRALRSAAKSVLGALRATANAARRETPSDGRQRLLPLRQLGREPFHLAPF